MPTTSGYTHCACRDCFDITISADTTQPELCEACAEAGCEPNNGECQRDDAYDDADDHTTAAVRKDTPPMSTTTSMPSYEQWRLLILLWRRGLFTAARPASEVLNLSEARPSDLAELIERGWIAATRDREPIDVRTDNQSWWAPWLRSMHLRLTAAGLIWLADNPHTVTMFAIAESMSGWRGVPLTAIAAGCGTDLDTLAWLASKNLVTVTAGGLDCDPARLGSGPVKATDTRRVKLTRRGQALLDT